jgi:nucleoid DNA-binding protein
MRKEGMRKKVKVSERNLLTNTEFFEKLSAESGYMDIESVKRVYYGMIRLASRELRLKNYFRLPDWGDFSVILHAGRTALNVNSLKVSVLPPTKVVKYEPDYKLKNYFKNL